MATVRVEKNGPVTTVIIDRPELRNAVDYATAQALFEAFELFESDATARVAVLTGEGGHFSAGADLKAIAAGQGNRLSESGSAPMGPTRMDLSKPVIAAINGYAVAGGLELALWCDLRIAEEDATMGVFCRRWGVPLVDGGTVRLPRIIGMGRALDLTLTGRPVDAQEALSMGLVNRVVKHGLARCTAEAMALQIASFPQACMLADRRSVYEQAGLDLETAMQAEFSGAQRTLMTETIAGANRFADGAGRHGTFDD